MASNWVRNLAVSAAGAAGLAAAGSALAVPWNLQAPVTRIAADIHDDVIQDLSMLVHRLDRAGEDDAAATLRGAIDRLRAICADLRLPVIHDLGLAARYCDAVVLLHEGRVVAAGGPEEVFTPERIRAAWGVEAAVQRCPATGTLQVVPLRPAVKALAGRESP